MAEEEEIRSEVEAVQAVYGEDCRVIDEFPPHLAVHIKPRTADDSSQQFVEVTLGLRSDGEYPKKPPYVYIVEMKGLDDNRQAHLITQINNKAQDLSSCLMLVALCEVKERERGIWLHSAINSRNLSKIEARFPNMLRYFGHNFSYRTPNEIIQDATER